jgi:hypothetical protein
VRSDPQKAQVAGESLLCVGSFAASIKEAILEHITLLGCDSAAQARQGLQNVESLELRGCHILNIGHLIRAATGIRKLTFRDREFNPPYFPTIRTNEDLVSLCDGLASPSCQVTGLSLDLAGNDGLPFPATSGLLRISRGSLSLFCYDFPENGFRPLLDGVSHLHCELDGLQLRLKGCKFGDADVAALFETLIPNRTLAALAMEFGHHTGKPLTLAAIDSFERQNSHLRVLFLFTRYGPETVPIPWEFRLEVLRRVIGALGTNRSLDTFRASGLKIGADDRHELVDRLHQVLRENENGQCNDVFHTLADDGKLLLPKDDPVPAAADVKFLLKLNCTADGSWSVTTSSLCATLISGPKFLPRSATVLVRRELYRCSW